MLTILGVTHRKANQVVLIDILYSNAIMLATAAVASTYFFLCEVIAHCPKSRVCTGPPTLGVISNSNMSTGIPIVAHALGTSTIPASLPSQGEADSSK
jgi:hypothetical protein